MLAARPESGAPIPAKMCRQTLAVKIPADRRSPLLPGRPTVQIRLSLLWLTHCKLLNIILGMTSVGEPEVRARGLHIDARSEPIRGAHDCINPVQRHLSKERAMADAMDLKRPELLAPIFSYTAWPRPSRNQARLRKSEVLIDRICEVHATEDTELAPATRRRRPRTVPNRTTIRGGGSRAVCAPPVRVVRDPWPGDIGEDAWA